MTEAIRFATSVTTAIVRGCRSKGRARDIDANCSFSRTRRCSTATVIILAHPDPQADNRAARAGGGGESNSLRHDGPGLLLAPAGSRATSAGGDPPAGGP